MKSKSIKKSTRKRLRKRKGTAYVSYNLGKFALQAILFFIMYVFVGLALFVPIFLLFL